MLPSFAEEEKEVEDIATGEPSFTQAIGAENFVPHTAYPRRNTRLGWFNYDLAREIGLRMPAEGLTPEYTATLLEHFGLGIPHKDDPNPAEHYDMDRPITVYPDLYGGYGNFDSEGSGRAASVGDFQLKGIGLTNLQRRMKSNSTSLWSKLWTAANNNIHTSGSLGLEGEGGREATWGELTNNELDNGGNRSLLLVDVGEGNAVQARQNIVRLGHYLSIRYRKRLDEPAERERLQGLYPRLFPGLEESDNPRELIRERFLEIADTMARTYAQEFGKGIFHGAMSPSNIGIGGEALDFGMITTVEGFPRLRSLPRNANWQGDTRGMELTLILPIRHDLQKYMPEQYGKHLPSKEELRTFVKERFQQQLDRDFLWRAGLPEELTTELAKDGAGQTFSRLLQKVAFAGNETPTSYFYKPTQPNAGKYNLPKVLKALLAGDINKLAKLIPDPILRRELQGSFLKYQEAAGEAASKHEISSEALMKYHQVANEMRNKPRKGLYNSLFSAYLGKYMEKVKSWFKGKEDPADKIDANIVRNTRTHKHRAPFSVVLDERYHPKSGLRVRRVYDAKTGRTNTEVLLARSGDKVNYMGKLLHPDAVAGELALRTGRKKIHPEGHETRGRHEVFLFPDTPIEKVTALETNAGTEELEAHKKAVYKDPCSMAALAGAE